jgi:hypothetical protein
MGKKWVKFTHFYERGPHSTGTYFECIFVRHRQARPPAAQMGKMRKTGKMGKKWVTNKWVIWVTWVKYG